MPAVLKIFLLCIVFVACAYDLRYRRVPNWLNLLGVIAGLGGNILLLGTAGLRAAMLGLLVASMVYVPLYLIRGMGAGDVKLMAAVGAIVGPRNWLVIFLVTAILGGIVALAAIAVKKRFHQTILNVGVIGAELLQFRVPAHREERLDIRHSDALRLPHAAVIAGGCLAFLLFSAGN
jgi:prepilin peptidase CpaA